MRTLRQRMTEVSYSFAKICSCRLQQIPFREGANESERLDNA